MVNIAGQTPALELDLGAEAGKEEGDPGGQMNMGLCKWKSRTLTEKMTGVCPAPLLPARHSLLRHPARLDALHTHTHIYCT